MTNGEQRGKAAQWVEAHYPGVERDLKALLILTYGAGLDAGLAEAQELIAGMFSGQR